MVNADSRRFFWSVGQFNLILHKRLLTMWKTGSACLHPFYHALGPSQNESRRVIPDCVPREKLWETQWFSGGHPAILRPSQLLELRGLFLYTIDDARFDCTPLGQMAVLRRHCP